LIAYRIAVHVTLKKAEEPHPEDGIAAREPLPAAAARVTDELC
jgi:hypothetical protein